MMRTSTSQSASALTRTQIYLSQAQQQALGELAHELHVPKSELIRQALDQWLEEQKKPKLSKLEMLRKIKGMWQDRSDMADGVGYVQELRKQGADQRLELINAARNHKG